MHIIYKIYIIYIHIYIYIYIHTCSLIFKRSFKRLQKNYFQKEKCSALYSEKKIWTKYTLNFYIIINSFTPSLDSDPQAIRSIMENF